MKQWFDILKLGVTAAHTIAYWKETLETHGFEELKLEEEWDLREGGSYVVGLFETAGFAFRVGRNPGNSPSFRIGMAHGDHPCLRLKPEPELRRKQSTCFNVELYGGLYQKSWLDRPLGVAGRIVINGRDAFHPKTLLYRSERPLCIIPSLAIHMDRGLNEKGALDVAKEMVPVAALTEQADLLNLVAGQLYIDREEILDFDLQLFNMDEPVLVGLDNSMLSSPRLDNLSSVSGLMEALIRDEEVPEHAVIGMAVFDHEEVGSRTLQGADSALLSMLLKRIGKALGKEGFSMAKVLGDSFLLSVDVAHGYHPNYDDKSDVTSRAYLGQGVCIKRSVPQKYGTTAETAAVLRQLCRQADIPYTIAVNKTGIPGGSTLGPLAASHLPMPCADVGIPILAMHSATELCAVADYEALRRLAAAFYF